MRELARDLRIAARTLMRARGFAAAAVLTLALGIALNVSVLAVVNAYLLEPLPYPESDRLYSIRYAPPDQNPPRGLAALDWPSLDDVIEHPIAWDLDMFMMLGGEHPERAPGAWVTPGFMQGLGIRAAMGRVFSPEDFRTGSPSVALISHALWQQRFGSDPAILDRRFNAYVSDRPDEAETFTIVGVLPPDFWHVNPYTQVLAPLRAPSYPYMARLRAGAPPQDVERRVTALVKAGVGSLPAGWHATVRTVHSEYVAQVRPILRAVAAATALVLVIACANVAFLLLIRATRREREIAVRMALGAGRGQIARLLAIEGLTLGAAATAAGLAFGWILLRWLPPIVERQLGRLVPGGPSAIALDPVVLTAALACGLVTAVAFALAPLAVSWRPSLAGATHAGPRGGSDSRGRRRARSTLVALEVAASLALLAGCAVLVRTAVHLFRVDLGIRTERVLATNVGLRDRTYPNDAARVAFFERVLPRLAEAPGVEAVGLANWPVVSPPRALPLEVAGAARSGLAAGVTAVSPGYFATLGIPTIEGRDFAPADRIGAEPVAVASETLARRLSPGRSAVGLRIRVAPRTPPGGPDVRGPGPGARTPRPDVFPWRTIIGVVRDVRQGPADEDRADVYTPLFQSPSLFTPVYARMSGAAAAGFPALRRALRDIDPEASLALIGVLDDLFDAQLARPRFLASLLAAFAGFAVLLALLGVYSVIAYAVRQREHEIAVRMAVGADARRVTLLFVRQGLVVLALGIALGLYGATTIRRLLEPQTHGVGRGDPSALIAAVIVFAAAGLAAIWWPARRAARTDPAVALRQE